MPEIRSAMLLAATAAAIVLTTGCASSAHMASAPMSASAALPTPAPTPLDHSLFAHDPNGHLDEQSLQDILQAPIELALPARVGVMPIDTATDWRGPGPDYERVPTGVAPLVERLRHDAQISLVTEMMPIPSGALGMESLREAAARYRLRYVVLYREVLARDTTLNPWGWLYATVVGMAFVPGQHHELVGYLEASMFDVKTGLLLFTTRRAVSAASTTNLWHQDQKMDKLADKVVREFAPDLGTDMLADLRRFATAVATERGDAHTPTPPPVAATTPAT